MTLAKFIVTVEKLRNFYRKGTRISIFTAHSVKLLSMLLHNRDRETNFDTRPIKSNFKST